MYEKGYIYKGKYEGWYSVPDETFLSGSQITDGMEPGTKVSHTLDNVNNVEDMYMYVSYTSGVSREWSHSGVVLGGELPFQTDCLQR